MLPTHTPHTYSIVHIVRETDVVVGTQLTRIIISNAAGTLNTNRCHEAYSARRIM